MVNKSRIGKAGIKHRMACGIPVGCQLPCSDNSGVKLLNVVSVYGDHGTLNRIPAASIGDVVLASVRKGKPELRKKLVKAVVIRQRKPWRRADGTFIYCEDNAAVVIKDNGEPKGTSITGPVAKECQLIFQKLVSQTSAVL